MMSTLFADVMKDGKVRVDNAGRALHEIEPTDVRSVKDRDVKIVKLLIVHVPVMVPMELDPKLVN